MRSADRPTLRDNFAYGWDRRLFKAESKMPEWVGTILFLAAVGLSGAKISEDFGERGLLGYGMLMLIIVVLAAAVSTAFV